MFELTDDDIKLKLLANEPIEIYGIGNLQLPSTRQVISMNESLHNTYLSYLLFSKENLSETSEEMDKLSDFEILVSFLYHDASFREVFFNALELIFGEKPNYEEGIIFFGLPSEESLFTEEKWDFVKKVLKIGNFIEDKKEEEIIPGNERARKFMEKLKRQKEQAPKVKSKQNLHSMISAISWKTVGINNVLDLTIYQLYDAFMRLENIDNYHYTLTGIYTGNIDSKGIKLSDINWANIIKVK
ncbi:hypothetical protein D3C84_484940 [compost metagenome]